MSENKDVLKIVEALGIKLPLWQKEVLTMLSKLPNDHRLIYMPRRKQFYVVARKSNRKGD